MAAEKEKIQVTIGKSQFVADSTAFLSPSF
jgi:hypothetical protein